MNTAEKLLAIAAAHIGEVYLLGAIAPKANPEWCGPWDCAEFCSWCVYQASGRLFGARPNNDPLRADAYSGYWAEDAENLGAIISVGTAAATPGAFLLRLPGEAIGHVAISCGDGSTIEAYSRKRGVIRAKVASRRWDYGVLVPSIEAVAAANPLPVAAPGIVLRLKTPAMTGPLVRRVQAALAATGFNPGIIDGEYGAMTQLAVRSFQLSKGLAVDGEVGALTAKALGIPWIG